MKNKNIINIFLFISIFSLASAYFIEYILGYKPCNLCLIERIPYFLSIIIIVFGTFLNRFEKTIFLLLSLVFAFATILTLYHVGIEQGFFEESLVCFSNSEISNLTKENLIKNLQETAISCKNVEFRLFGMSLATINAILSLFLSVISFKIFLNYEKNR
tara:strand:- start:845 stop:1321 length:477 start_codon:yes stop_codon:yes gene_type:complete